MLFNNKKGVEITLQTVIIAVLVIVVLIVLLFIFTKGSSGFLTGVTSCDDRGGYCATDSQECTASRGHVYRLGKCDNGVCCLPESSLSGQDNEPI